MSIATTVNTSPGSTFERKQIAEAPSTRKSFLPGEAATYFCGNPNSHGQLRSVHGRQVTEIGEQNKEITQHETAHTAVQLLSGRHRDRCWSGFLQYAMSYLVASLVEGKGWRPIPPRIPHESGCLPTLLAVRQSHRLRRPMHSPRRRLLPRA